MRVAVVGCGYWGSKHVRVLSEFAEVELIVAVDTRDDPQVFDGLRAPVRRMADLDEALALVDAVVVATPPGSHAAVARQAMAKGKHVLVEKPLAHTVLAATQMVADAQRANVVLMTGHTFEFNPAVRALRDAVQAGRMGRIHFIDSVRLNLGLVRRDVDVIADLATHDISIANFVLDARPDRVTAWSSAHTHRSVADTATIRLDYDRPGTTVEIRVSWFDPVKVRRTTVVGSDLMAVFDDLDAAARLTFFDRGIIDAGDGSPITERLGPSVVPDLPATEPLRVEIQEFLDAVATGIAPACDGQRGLDVVRIVEAAQGAARSRATVEVAWEDVPSSLARRPPALRPSVGVVEPVAVGVDAS